MPVLLSRFLILPLLRLLNLLAGDTAARVGGGIGLLAFHLGVRRRVAAQSLHRCLGLTGSRRRDILQRSYATIGANFLALLTVGGPCGPERQVTVLAPTALRRRVQAGSACWLAPHLGAWDLAAHCVGSQGRGVIAYAKPQHDPPVDAYVNALRAQLGITVVMAATGDRSAALHALRATRAGTPLGLMADQRPGRHEGSPGRFFGAAAWCHQGPGFFAGRLGLPLIVGACLRRRADRLVFVFSRPRSCAGRDELATIQLAQDLQAALIACAPGQYFWQHRRFAGPPPDMPAPSAQPWRAKTRYLAGM